MNTCKKITALTLAALCAALAFGCAAPGVQDETESQQETEPPYVETEPQYDETPFTAPEIDGMTVERYTETSSIYRFNYDGRSTIVVRPDKPLAGYPTVWRCEFFEAFDTVDKALLEKGWHIVYHRASNMYGCPESLEMLHDFYGFAIENFGVSAKPVLFGFSRGGLYAVNYAAAYPDEVGGIYLDAPVQDIRDWPCRDDMKGTAERADCMRMYGLDEETLKTFDKNPIDKAEEIAHLPVVIVAGLADTTVIWELNGMIMSERLQALNANVLEITKPDCAHHPHSLEDPTPVVEFIEKYCK